MRDGLIVAYYTPQYRDEAEGLRQTVQALGLRHEIDEVESAGGWRDNAHLRPQYLTRKRQHHPGEWLLSLDADARVRSNPWPLIPDSADVAWHDHTRPDGTIEPLPGTLLVGPSLGGDLLLARWARLNSQHPERNDRVNFAEAAAAFGDSGWRMPVELCFIFDTHREQYPGVAPVIEHFQASRRMRQLIGVDNACR